MDVGMFSRAIRIPCINRAWQKLNPLQILTYLGFKILIVPVVIVSGLLYMYHKTININNVGGYQRFFPGIGGTLAHGRRIPAGCLSDCACIHDHHR